MPKKFLYKGPAGYGMTMVPSISVWMSFGSSTISMGGRGLGEIRKREERDARSSKTTTSNHFFARFGIAVE